MTTKYECLECGWEGPDDELELIHDYDERVSPGEFAPAGECPECGALIGCSTQDIVEAGNVPAMVSILQELGYTVTKETLL